MVKEYTLSTLLDDTNVQEVYQAIWEDSSVWAGYHHSCDHPDAVVSPWQNGERRVTFSTPLKAPAFVKKIVGVEVLEIIETQLLQRHADGSLVVESKPVLAAPGASKFLTHALFSMSDEVNGKKSCKIEVQITCTCSVWGMQTTVESMMISQAEESASKFLAWANKKFLEVKQAAAVAKPVPSVVVMGQDEFHDALESAAEAASTASSSSDRQAESEEEEEMQTGTGQVAIRPADMTFEQAIRHYMDEIACTARDTNSQLQTLDNRIQEMTEDIAALRKAVVPSRHQGRPSSSHTLLGSNLTWYIGGTAIAAASYACFVYFRSNRSSGGSQLL